MYPYLQKYKIQDTMPSDTLLNIRLGHFERYHKNRVAYKYYNK